MSPTERYQTETGLIRQFCLLLETPNNFNSLPSEEASLVINFPPLHTIVIVLTRGHFIGPQTTVPWPCLVQCDYHASRKLLQISIIATSQHLYTIIYAPSSAPCTFYGKVFIRLTNLQDLHHEALVSDMHCCNVPACLEYSRQNIASRTRTILDYMVKAERFWLDFWGSWWPCDSHKHRRQNEHELLLDFVGNHSLQYVLNIYIFLFYCNIYMKVVQKCTNTKLNKACFFSSGPKQCFHPHTENYSGSTMTVGYVVYSVSFSSKVMSLQKEKQYLMPENWLRLLWIQIDQDYA